LAEYLEYISGIHNDTADRHEKEFQKHEGQKEAIHPDALSIGVASVSSFFLIWETATVQPNLTSFFFITILFRM